MKKVSKSLKLNKKERKTNWEFIKNDKKIDKS